MEIFLPIDSYTSVSVSHLSEPWCSVHLLCGHWHGLPAILFYSISLGMWLPVTMETRGNEEIQPEQVRLQSKTVELLSLSIKNMWNIFFWESIRFFLEDLSRFPYFDEGLPLKSGLALCHALGNKGRKAFCLIQNTSVRLGASLTWVE